MRIGRVVGLGLVTLAAIGGGALSAAVSPKVPYPEGYRAWLHLKSMVIHDTSHPLFEAFGGIHHVYVNPAGAKAARSGGAYPDGTVLVFDLLEAKGEGGAMSEGARKFVGVMAKNSAAHAATGGWGFEAFKGDTKDQRIVTDAKTQCFACHQSRQSSGYVFSVYRR